LATAHFLSAKFIRFALQAAAVTLVADVRTVSRSGTNPQYNHDILPQSLAQSHIAYRHIAALGGLRRKDRGVALNVNAFRQNTSFHNYADYAMCASFRSGLTELKELGCDQCCAISSPLLDGYDDPEILPSSSR